MTNREIDERIALELFGWRWVSWIDIPIKRTPGYPKVCRVRQLLPPKALADKRWKEHWAQPAGRDADGSEPLAYCYCSSSGPEFVPDFLGEDDVKVLIQVRKLWQKDGFQWKYFRGCLRPAEAYRVGDYSRAVIMVLDLGKKLL